MARRPGTCEASAATTTAPADSANAIGAGASIRFMHVVGPDASDRMVGAIRTYHARLGHLAAVPTSSVVERAEHRIDRLRCWAHAADLVVIGATDAGQHVDAEFTPVVDHLA